MSSIDHPQHYQSTELEAIDVIEGFNLNFRLGNTIKYILRSGRKGDHIEDLLKAHWYLSREIAHEIRKREQHKSVNEDGSSL